MPYRPVTAIRYTPLYFNIISPVIQKQEAGAKPGRPGSDLNIRAAAHFFRHEADKKTGPDTIRPRCFRLTRTATYLIRTIFLVCTNSSVLRR